MRALRTYDDWKHCITEICKVPLTAEFVEQRLRDLRDQQSFETQKFIRSWGEPHLGQVIAWLEQARSELAGQRTSGIDLRISP